jgi:hypothetical protein
MINEMRFTWNGRSILITRNVDVHPQGYTWIKVDQQLWFLTSDPRYATRRQVREYAIRFLNWKYGGGEAAGFTNPFYDEG